MHLHQIWFDLGMGSEPPGPNGISSMLEYADASGLVYKLWSEKDADTLICTLPGRVQHVWNNLPHKINKIDFFRYILLYTFGGAYFDVDFHCVKQMSELLRDHTTFLCEEWPFSYNDGSLHNGVLICKSAGHPLWMDVISEVEARLTLLKNDECKDIQKSVFQLTGTAMLRDVASYYLYNHDLIKTWWPLVVLPFGFFCPLICGGSKECEQYIDSYDLKDKKLICLKAPSQANIDSHARCFTLGYLSASVKIWQRNFHNK